MSSASPSSSTPSSSLLSARWQKALLRPLAQTDLEAIMPIEQACYGEHHWSRDSFASEMKNPVSQYRALCLDNALVGYCGCWAIGDEGHVITLATDPNWQGYSLGELLFVHQLERLLAQNIQSLTLEVRASNQKAQNLYYKYGFKVVGLRPRYYQNNQEDGLLMTVDRLQEPEQLKAIATLKAKLQQKVAPWPESQEA
jgi:[ribosomal protein S18]-alanine N-acetyltransferase